MPTTSGHTTPGAPQVTGAPGADEALLADEVQGGDACDKDKLTATPITNPVSTTTARLLARFPGRDGLGAYIAAPQAFPAGQVIISQSAAFVALHDRYPKGSVHTLLLPRDPTKTLVHPLDVFDDPDFLSLVRAEVAVLHRFVAAELRRRFGRFSSADRAREQALLDLSQTQAAEPPLAAQLPPGRDWSQEILSGVHAGPSMSHLHIHVLSRDMHSACMRHGKHYNSFHTPFLVGLDEFPLAADDPRRTSEGKRELLAQDLRCWKCGRNFKNRFTQLKSHLEEEFEVWKNI